MAVNLVHVFVKFFAQVGDGEQFEIGSALIPLKAAVHGRSLVIELDDSFATLKAMVKHAFADEGSADA